MFSKIHVLYKLYIYVYRSFSTMLNKGLRENIRKKKKDWEAGKHTLNETKTWSTEHEIEKLKQTR